MTEKRKFHEFREYMKSLEKQKEEKDQQYETEAISARHHLMSLDKKIEDRNTKVQLSFKQYAETMRMKGLKALSGHDRYNSMKDANNERILTAIYNKEKREKARKKLIDAS